jgi:hypothetical protein
MNELQMLLFAHAVNASREERGLPPINVVWLWGFGSKLPLPQAGEGWGEGGGAPAATTLTPGAAGDKLASASPACGRGEHAPLDFLTALRNGNVPAWQSARQTRSSEILSADTIILGDSHPRLRLTPRKSSVVSRFISSFHRKPALEQVLATLQQQL